jgi:hypothetical protein
MAEYTRPDRSPLEMLIAAAMREALPPLVLPVGKRNSHNG